MKTKKRPTTRAERRAKRPANISNEFEPGFLSQVDGRLSAAKLIKQQISLLMTDTGADTEQKKLLVERAAFIALQLQTMECEALESGTLDRGVYTQMCNALSGLLSKLGIDRKGQKLPPLNVYLDKKGASKP